MKKQTLKLKKVTLGKLTSSEMKKAIGGQAKARSDSYSTQFTEVNACCKATCPTGIV